MIGVLVASVAMMAAGASLGIVAIVSIGVHREQKAARRPTPDSPGPLARGVREITGLSVQRAGTWD